MGYSENVAGSLQFHKPNMAFRENASIAVGTCVLTVLDYTSCGRKFEITGLCKVLCDGRMKYIYIYIFFFFLKTLRQLNCLYIVE